MPLQLTFCTHIIHSKNAKYHSLLMLSRQISDIVFPVSSCKSINFWYSSSVIRTWNRRSFEPFFLLPFFIRSSPPLRKIKESDLGIEPRTSHFHVCSTSELIIFFHKTPCKFHSKRRALVRTPRSLNRITCSSGCHMDYQPLPDEYSVCPLNCLFLRKQTPIQISPLRSITPL